MNVAIAPSPVAAPRALSISLAGSAWGRLLRAVMNGLAELARRRRERRLRAAVEQLNPRLVADLGLEQWLPPRSGHHLRELDRMGW